MKLMDRNSDHPAAFAADPKDEHPHSHSVRFYGEDSFLVDDLSRFVGSALGSGESAVVIATGAHRRGLEERLRAAGLDVNLAVNQGRYVALDAAKTLTQFMVDGDPDPTLFAATIGEVLAAASADGRSIVAFGEMVALLWEEGNSAAALRLERLWNDLAHVYEFELRCAYPMRLFPNHGDAEQLQKVCAEHSHVRPTESYTLLGDPDQRLRAIALLQQKALALETEIKEKNRLLIAEREARATIQKIALDNARLYQAAQEAIVHREEFLSVAAHELKTPITSVRAAAQLLLRRVPEGEPTKPELMTRMLSVLDLETEKLGRLVNQLLDVSRVHAAQLSLDRTDVDVAQLVRSTVERTESQVTRHSFVVQGLHTALASVDSLRIEQVLTNLLDNAVKYSPRAGDITVDVSQPDSQWIQISVRDHGIGLSPDQCERVFERFFRAAENDRTTGLGLGLYISREIAERHGGRLWAETPEDGGSRFVMQLPLVP